MFYDVTVFQNQLDLDGISKQFPADRFSDYILALYIASIYDASLVSVLINRDVSRPLSS